MIWKYIVGAIIVLILVAGLLAALHMSLRATQREHDRRKAKRDRRFIEDLRTQSLVHAEIDPTSQQYAYKITDHLIDD